MRGSATRRMGMLLAGPALAASLAAATQRDVARAPELEPGAGRDLILMNCVACHSTRIITAHHMSRERWDAAITRMQAEDGLWPFSDDDRRAILDYLESTQGPTGETRSGTESPWAQPLYQPNPIY